MCVVVVVVVVVVFSKKNTLGALEYESDGCVPPGERRALGFHRKKWVILWGTQKNRAFLV